LVTHEKDAAVAEPVEFTRAGIVSPAPTFEDPTALFQLLSCPMPAAPVTMPSPVAPPADTEFAFPPPMLMLMVEALKAKEESNPEASETASKVFNFIKFSGSKKD
jgi:hypothetical protein